MEFLDFYPHYNLKDKHNILEIISSSTATRCRLQFPQD